jgi:hypothetical protein
MVLGRELIADVEDIENYCVLETINSIKPLMKKIAKNVI